MDSVLAILGIVLTLIGVLILAREVLFSHKIEGLFWGNHVMFLDLENLIIDPVGQGLRDIQILRESGETLTPQERIALKMQEVILTDPDMSKDQDLIKEMRKQAVIKKEEFKKAKDYLERKINPAALKKRTNLLKLGIAFIIVGSVSQVTGILTLI